MSLYKRGRYWYYDFELKGRRYKETTRTTSKTLARQIEAERMREVREGRNQVRDIPFSELAEKYLRIHAANRKGRFHEYTIRVLSPHFNGKMLSEISRGDVEAFMAKRRAEVATATANRSLAVLKHMLNKAVDWNHLLANPASKIRPERERNHREFFLNEQQATELVRRCPNWLRPVVVTALHTGARQGELLALEWNEVDLERGLLTFRETKNGEPRTVKMSETVRETLRGLSSRFEGGRVFRNHGGRPIHRAGLTWSFRRAVRLAGLEGFRFHDLRHSAASFMVQAKVPLNTVREILGHKSLKMTLRYAHLAPDHQAEAMAAMDALASGRNGRTGVGA